MIRATPPTRREILTLLLSSVGSVAALRRAVARPPDQGIGGTGAAPPTLDDSDRGIGGTGVIGTIRKFGSIIVNDMRIAYPADADIRIDGRPATAKDLKVGQVVRVVAAGPARSLSTQAIDVTSEVVGPVERTNGKTMVVLGQTVSTAALKAPNVRAGETVAVSGLRRNDGTIVASLVERRPNAPSRVAGPVVVARDGALKIGNLALSGVDPDLIGRRAVLDGARDGDRFVVSHGSSEAALLSNVRTLSIESYVERHGTDLALGSGFSVAGADGIAVPTSRSVLAVVTTSIGPDGRLSVDSVRTGGQTYRSGGPVDGRSGRGPGGRGPGEGSGGRGQGNGPGQRGNNGRIPMDFGHNGGSGGGAPGGATPPGGFGGSGNSMGGPGMGGPGGAPPGGGGFGGGGPGGGGPGGGGRR